MAICFMIDPETICIHYIYSLAFMAYFITKTKKIVTSKNNYSKDKFSKKWESIISSLTKSQENNQMVIQG